jgi:DNA-binding transcriptional ArsR family regulator
MVEYSLSIDNIFSSLADPTRRDILNRVAQEEMSVGQIATAYDLTFAAVSKHLKVLEKAKLIIKRKRGKERIVQAVPGSLEPANEYLESYRQMWESRFELLDELLKED